MALSKGKIEKLEEEFNGERVLQYERKRWGFFGLPFTFTKYYLTEKRFVKRSGLLNFEEDEVLLYRVLDICIRMSLWQKIFGLGTIELITSDKTDPNVIIKNIKNTRRFKNNLSEYVEIERNLKRVRMGEIVDNNESDDETFEHGEVF